MQKQEETQPNGYTVIARDKFTIITRLICTRKDSPLLGAMNAARSVLRLKRGAERVEVHHTEGQQSMYAKRPLATFSIDDMLEEELIARERKQPI